MARLTLSTLLTSAILLTSSISATPVDPAHPMITAAPVLAKRAPLGGSLKLRCDQKASDQPAACSAFESAISHYLPGSIYSQLEADYESVASVFIASALSASTTYNASALQAGALLTLLPKSDQSVVGAFGSAVSSIRSQYSLTGSGYLRPDDVTFVTGSSESSTSSMVSATTTISAIKTSSSMSSAVTAAASSTSSAAAVAGFRPEGAGVVGALLMVLAGLLA